MTVKIKCRHIVKPAEPTWTGIFPLSELDQTGDISFVPMLYIYTKPIQFFPDIHKQEIIKSLKDALSRILVPFYPFAGRISSASEGGRMKLECNAKGVELIEAETNRQVSDFSDVSSNNQEMFDLVPDVDFMITSTKTIIMHELPTLIVQITWFKCGGISIATSMSHVVGDGQAWFQFLTEFARLVRENEYPLEALPYLDRRVLQQLALEDDDDHQLEDQVVNNYIRFPSLKRVGENLEQQKEMIKQKFILSKQKVCSLKEVANNYELNGKAKHGRPYTRFEVIVSHIWRCVCKARGLHNQQTSAVYFAVDSRTRLDPSLPPRYFGNATLIAMESSKSGDLISKPLNQICQQIREKIEKMNSKYFRSAIKYLKQQSDLSKFQQQTFFGDPQEDFENPNILITCVLGMTIRGLDFGWGREKYMGYVDKPFDGDIVLMPANYVDDGSVLVSVCLKGHHMEKFKTHFYDDIREHGWFVSKI